MDSEQRCGTCRFWSGQVTFGSANCRRYPPTVLVHTSPNGKTVWENVLPYVIVAGWCGEWSKRDD